MPVRPRRLLGRGYEALTGLTGVAVVTPYADAADSTAEVFLGGDGLPDLDAWPAELARSANGSYAFRGVEVGVDGTVERRGDDLVLVTRIDRRSACGRSKRATSSRGTSRRGAPKPRPPRNAPPIRTSPSASGTTST